MIELQMKNIVIALLLVNFVGILATYIDKNRAKFGIERVPERVLMFLGAIGGAAGMLMMMHLIRHKTRRQKFMVGFPIMIVVHVLIFIWVRYSSFIMILY